MVRIVLAGLLGLAMAAPAHAEVTAKGESGFVIHLEADVAQPPAAVWPVLISPAKWWSGEHTYSRDSANLFLDAQASGCFCELLPKPQDAPEGQRRGSVEHMRVLAARPGVALRMAGALGPLQGEALNGTLTITLGGTKEGTHLVFDYVVGGYSRFKLEEIAPAVDKVLGEQLTRLVDAAQAPPADAPTPPAQAK